MAKSFVVGECGFAMQIDSYFFIPDLFSYLC